MFSLTSRGVWAENAFPLVQTTNHTTNHTVKPTLVQQQDLLLSIAQPIHLALIRQSPDYDGDLRHAKRLAENAVIAAEWLLTAIGDSILDNAPAPEPEHDEVAATAASIAAAAAASIAAAQAAAAVTAPAAKKAAKKASAPAKAPEPEPEPEPKPEAPAEPITHDKIRALGKELILREGSDRFKAVIAQFGASTVSSLAPGDLSAVAAQLNVLLTQS